MKAALSMTIPTGTGIHRRMVYIELKDGYEFDKVTAAIKADPYFVNDETHVNWFRVWMHCSIWVMG